MLLGKLMFTQSVSVLCAGLGTYALYAVIMFLLMAVIYLAVQMLSTVFKLRGKTLMRSDDFNGLMFLVFMVLFFGFVWWQFSHWGHKMGVPGSEHGVVIDKMFMITTVITMIVFIAVHILLFYFTKEGRKMGKNQFP